MLGLVKILDSLGFDLPTDEQIISQLESMKVPMGPNEIVPQGHIRFGRFHSTQGFMQSTAVPRNLIDWKRNPGSFQQFAQHYLRMFASRFGGKERFQLTMNKPASDLKSLPTSCLSRLFQDDSKRAEVRTLIHEAFGRYFVIDPTSIGTLEVRLSDTPPPSSSVERGWTDESTRFHKAAKPISDFSDGVQAFTGLAMTVIAGEEKIMLIDEPEAFLHPSLAFLLGKKLSELMSSRDGNLIVATHSAHFVMGCLQSGKKLNIIRLTNEEGVGPTARHLSSDKVAELFKNPLLRSTGVMQGLFYSNVVVGEGDADRAFYNEINERMLSNNPSEGIPSPLFLNAQNKQTVWDILSPLRGMGIPAVGIVDIDFVKDGGATFTKALSAAGVPTTLHESLQNMRTKVKLAFDATRRDMKRDGGINLLTGENKELALKFLNDLAEYGLFVVPGGEVESWLKQLECTGHGPEWLIQLFGKLGSDPGQTSYVKPAAGDVWDFIRSIQKWVANPKKKGLG